MYQKFNFDQINRQINVTKVRSPLSTRNKIVEYANSVDLDEVAHDEPPHLEPHCLPCSL